MNNHTISLPWAAAVRAAEQQQLNATPNQSVNAFDRNNTIGSWSSPETSSSVRSGWNADGSMKADGTPDDGTAIWGNPSSKKAGIDWAEKESLSNPPQTTDGNPEKRTQKTEPTISSLNGTEAWGAPPPVSGPGGVNSMASNTVTSQQQSKSNETSGNTYGTKSINDEPLGWRDSSSSFSLKQGNIENSSPPTNSFWNNLTNNGKQQKSPSDWLSSNSSSKSAMSSSRLDELNKQLEATSLFDALSSTSPPSASSSMAKHLSAGNITNHENQSSASVNVGLGGLDGSDSFNDLKRMSANFNKNDLIEATSRPSMSTLSSVSSGATNNPQSQMNPYSLGMAPSRDLLKQMVHQIQLAVQAGHLNAQILNQPMSTPTLQLVYTLLQQIKLLQQFQDVHQRTVNKLNGGKSPSNLDLQIKRVQQNISLLHKAITQQQAALTKNESLVDSNSKQHQAANNYSYANISKLSTNMKVPSNNVSDIISNNSIESFKRSNLIDTLTANSNSDQQRMSQTDTLDSDTAIDKNLSPLFQTVNILNNKAQSFNSGSSQQQLAQKCGLLPAQTPTSSAAAWLAFNSSDLVSSSSSSSSSSGWPTSRISSKVSQKEQQQINSDLISDMVNPKTGWRNAAMLSNDAKDNNAQASANVALGPLAPGSNLNLSLSNSGSNNIRQMNETNDILNKNSAYYDWSVNNADARRRNYDSNESSPPAIGGLSLQSNPWLFAPTSTSLNIVSGIDNLNEKNTGNSFCGKMDNGNNDKIGGDALGFLSSGDMQRTSSALYDWGGLGSSSMQYNAEPAPIGSKQSSNSNNGNRIQSTSAIGSNSRPAPPPGLMSNFGSVIGANSGNSSRSTMDGSSLDQNKLVKSSDESQMPSLDSSPNPWSGAWFD